MRPRTAGATPDRRRRWARRGTRSAARAGWRSRAPGAGASRRAGRACSVALAAAQAGHLEHEPAPLGERAPRRGRRCRRRSGCSGRPSAARRARTAATCSRCARFTPSGSRPTSTPPTSRACRASDAAGRTACGWSWTCRRRCRRGSRRSRPCATVERHVVDGDELAEAARELANVDGVHGGLGDAAGQGRGSAPDARVEPRLGQAHGGERARAVELGLSSATCASSTSVLVATPAAKRSPTTRRASVARADARGGGADGRAARLDVQPALPHVGARAACRTPPARSRARARWRRPRPPRPRTRPPSQSGQLTLTPTSHDGCHSSARGKIRGFGRA